MKGFWKYCKNLFEKTLPPSELVLAMIVARIIDPRSKLATCRGLGQETSFSSLGEMPGVTRADEDELYAAMD
jgi:hypothetical protein